MNSTDQNQNSNNGVPIKRTLAGGILGAAFGYIATPENRKRLIAKVDKDKMKNNSIRLSNKAKELSKQSIQNIKSNTADYFRRRTDEETNDHSDTEISATVEPIETEELQQVMEENKELKNRLNKLESKLDQLSEVTEDRRKKEKNSSNTQQKKNSTKSKTTSTGNNKGSNKNKNDSKKDKDTGKKAKKDTALSSNDDTSS
ncbi:GvpT/GvpP family gas vesicle accessory protein [Pseudalkalibacillus berkeleyi]|uniref:YtxH domain-containing protein n=1 Tax=Pseudalkalibacillus berkeleyi TaxID=1069813 RepID=A0ABS9H0E6_9BACL|nr:GvpT/GvpP family gas vesicle accessory protein [Pseudalkalibacillus berkeleyi]MCF6137391.1 hypothetical protein [Pseudalkalibacillus berkeleyi]